MKNTMHVTISKEFTFDAAHHLPTVPVDHKCHRMHGHTYRVELQIRGVIAPNGFCGGIDYADIAALYQERVHRVLDHRVLNDVPGLEIPSTEHLAWWIAAQIAPGIPAPARLMCVRVCESSSTWCEARSEDGSWPYYE